MADISFPQYGAESSRITPAAVAVAGAPPLTRSTAPVEVASTSMKFAICSHSTSDDETKASSSEACSESSEPATATASECSDSEMSEDSSPRLLGGATPVCHASARDRPQTVYPVVLLLQLRAVLCGSTAQALGYGTEARPREAEESPKKGGTPAVPALPQKQQPKQQQPKQPKQPKQQPKQQGLVVSPTSWAAQQQRLKEDVADGTEATAQVTRAVRSILNKLTVERFEVLYEKVAACGVRTPEHVAILVSEIFGKATEQHKFIGMYVDLCVRLASDPRIGPPAMTAPPSPAADAAASGDLFRRKLLDHCQRSFEGLFQKEAADEESGDVEALEEARIRRKQRSLGNMKLVGWLLVRGMLSPKLLLTCSEELLSGRTACPDDALELLCALLTVAGPAFDGRSDWALGPRLEAVFAKIRALIDQGAAGGVSQRVRFLLRDLLELRGSKWADARRVTTEARACPRHLEEAFMESAQTPVPRRKSGKVVAADATTTMPSNQSRGAGADKAMIEPRGGTIARADGKVKGHPHEAPEKGSSQKCHASLKSIIETMEKQEAYQQPTKAAPLPLSRSMGRSGPRLSSAVAVAATPKEEAEAPRPLAALAPVATAPAAPAPEVPRAFNRTHFRRELTAVLKELSACNDVPGAVRRIRAQAVPVACQAAEFADLLTRAAEESRGPARRASFAFTAGLANGENSAFDRAECLRGVDTFFREIYEGLCEEVPRLPQIVSAELLPTLREVFSPAQLGSVAVPRIFLLT